MAIQGIISGFADPEDFSKNVVLVGRGDSYVLLVDGKPTGQASPEFDASMTAFREKCKELCSAHWQTVIEVVSNNVNDISTVLNVGTYRFEEQLGQFNT